MHDTKLNQTFATQGTTYFIAAHLDGVVEREGCGEIGREQPGAWAVAVAHHSGEQRERHVHHVRGARRHALEDDAEWTLRAKAYDSAIKSTSHALNK